MPKILDEEIALSVGKISEENSISDSESAADSLRMDDPVNSPVKRSSTNLGGFKHTKPLLEETASKTKVNNIETVARIGKLY